MVYIRPGNSTSIQEWKYNKDMQCLNIQYKTVTRSSSWSMNWHVLLVWVETRRGERLTITHFTLLKVKLISIWTAHTKFIFSKMHSFVCYNDLITWFLPGFILNLGLTGIYFICTSFIHGFATADESNILLSLTLTISEPYDLRPI